jgi:integrase
MKYGGTRLVYSTGETVTTNQWNKKKQRLKNNSTTTADGKHNLNDLLKNLEKECEIAYNTKIGEGKPAPETIKAHLKAFMDKNNNKEEKKISLLSFIGKFKEESKETKAPTTIKRYGTVLGHLQDYSKKKGKIDFDSINLDFFHSYVSFLKAKKLAKNSIAKDISVLKTFMNEAVDRGHTNNINFKHRKFSYGYEDTDSVYLSEQEINKLFNHDFSSNKKLDHVRDLFVFGCQVGLRYSDYSTVRPENIITEDGKKFINIITQKTKETVIVPCSAIVLKIFEKYKANANWLPKSISAQKFNEYLKDACKDAGLTETGRLTTDPKLPLYECISSHTARRSFATNLYLQKFPTIELMRITGHRTEKAFLKYIKVGKFESAKRLGEHMEMRNSQLLKIAG